MNTLNKLAIGLLLSSFSLSAGASCVSSIPESTPSARFADNGDGTVTDMRTGLMWMRCSLGQTWSGTTCTGTIAQYVWADALAQAQASTFASHSDWRLPNVKELLSIVEYRCSNPAINSEIFPATTWNYWSSSPNVSGAGTDAYSVGFGEGADLVDHKIGINAMLNNNVRLVRTVH